MTQPEYGKDTVTIQDPPLLFNFNMDPSVKYNIADKHPKIIAEMKEILKQLQVGIVPVENQLEK